MGYIEDEEVATYTKRKTRPSHRTDDIVTGNFIPEWRSKNLLNILASNGSIIKLPALPRWLILTLPLLSIYGTESACHPFPIHFQSRIVTPPR